MKQAERFITLVGRTGPSLELRGEADTRGVTKKGNVKGQNLIWYCFWPLGTASWAFRGDFRGIGRYRLSILCPAWHAKERLSNPLRLSLDR